VASLGAQTCSGSPLAIECSEGVSTSSSPVDGPGTSLNLNAPMAGMLNFCSGQAELQQLCTLLRVLED
jgi:hypothetical protein